MRTRLALVLALACLGTDAHAQLTRRCDGETWAQLANARFGRPELGRLLALYNGAGGAQACTPGKFVRFPITTRHELKLGQNLASVLSRFCSAPGAMSLVLEHNQLPSGMEPAPGTWVLIPSELALPMGSRPEAALADIPGLPSLATIRAYNQISNDEALPAGGTLYIPLFLDAADRFLEEAGAANVFVVLADGTLATPKLGSILPGVTRDSLLVLARDLGIPCSERDITVEDLKLAREMFCAGTAAVLTSVDSVSYKGQEILFPECPGPVAAALAEEMRGIVSEEKPDKFGWLFDVYQ